MEKELEELIKKEVSEVKLEWFEYNHQYESEKILIERMIRKGYELAKKIYAKTN